MSKLHINIGDSANDRTGDPLRTAFSKVNSNFDELYARTGDDIQIPVLAGNSGKVLTTNGTSLSWEAGLSVTDFGEGFSLTSSDKIVTNKLYSTNLTQSSQHYRLELDTNGVVILPDQSIINGATLKSVAGNYAGITAGPVGADEDSWMWVDDSGVTIATKFSTDAFTWKFDNNGNLTLPNGVDTVSGEIRQRNTRTINQGYTTVTGSGAGIVYSGEDWQTGFKLIIMAETRLDNNIDDVNHTQLCEALVASNYDSNADPVMSVYGVTYTSPNPLATFEVRRTGTAIEVVANNLQTQYNLQVSVHVVQFGSYYD